MKKYILPLLVMGALMAHMGYRYVQTDAFVFDTQTTLEEALLSAEQQEIVPAMAANYLVPTQSPLPEFTTTVAQPKGLNAFSY